MWAAAVRVTQRTACVRRRPSFACDYVRRRPSFACDYVRRRPSFACDYVRMSTL
jgi:hypothetical protein